MAFTKITEFTDGAGKQYKSRGPFADISYAVRDFGVPFERCFFGSRHGKGPSDGVSGVVKSVVRRAVVSRQAVVNNAKDMYSYCHLNLTKDSCSGQRRSFFFVESVNRDRANRECTKTVPGMQTLHSVKSVEPGIIRS